MAYFTLDDERFIREYYPIYGARYCGRRLGRPISSIHDKARRMNLTITMEQRIIIQKQGYERPFDTYPVNPIQFIDVTTPEAAYILGLVWADGYVRINGRAYRFEFTLIQTDFDVIRPVLNKLGRWRIDARRPRRISWKAATTACLGCKPLVEYLVAKDYHIKSVVAPTKILSTIPDHLKHYWWRGYFDGDGSISRERKWGGKLVFCGSFNQDWTEHLHLINRLGATGQIYRNKRSYGNNSVVSCCKREDIVLIGLYLYSGYPEDNIGLYRKYQVWKEISQEWNRVYAMNHIEITESSVFIKTDSDLLTIIRRYSGRLNRRRIVRHFDICNGTIGKMLGRLSKRGEIYGEGHTHMRVYHATNLSSLTP